MGTSILEMEPRARLSLRMAIEDSIREGIRFFVTSTVRSFAEQLRLFLRFKAGLAKFPAAPPGQSTHQRGIAVDLVPRDPSTLDDVVELMIRHGFKWAGPRDRVHFTHQGGDPRRMRQVDRRAIRKGIRRPLPPPGAPPGTRPAARFPALPICHS